MSVVLKTMPVGMKPFGTQNRPTSSLALSIMAVVTATIAVRTTSWDAKPGTLVLPPGRD